MHWRRLGLEKMQTLQELGPRKNCVHCRSQSLEKYVLQEPGGGEVRHTPEACRTSTPETRV